MSSALRVELESLLRHRQLDRTLTTNTWADISRDVAATGLEILDEQLGGGIARGHLSELVGPRSSGRTTVVCRMFRAAANRGEAIAFIDTCDRFDPASAAASGVDLSKLLWVRERGDASRALKAMNLVLQAGGFGLVVFDVADVAPIALRQFPVHDLDANRTRHRRQSDGGRGHRRRTHRAQSGRRHHCARTGDRCVPGAVVRRR
jgi:hypothetical protein